MGLRTILFGSAQPTKSPGMFLALPPAADLSALVHAYCFVEDLPGEYEGQPIRTSPVPFAILSVNIGRANAAETGALVPDTALLGLQSRARSWQSWSETYFVMAVLTVAGLVRLFPHTGAGTADQLLDLGAITGDASARRLSDGVGLDRNPRAMAALLDGWLIARLGSTPPLPEQAQIVAAHDVLRRGGGVEAAAAAAQADRRSLLRWFRRHLGVAPKALADLERLHASLRGVQTGQGDPVAGFSDQAHQIRNWRRRLGVTPGAYARGDRSSIATRFGAHGAGLAFYL